MRIINLLLFIVVFQTSIAQESKGSINVFEIVGTWTNVSYSYGLKPHTKKGNEIGKISTDKRITIPTSNDSDNHFIEIKSDGKFLDIRHPNAMWKLTDNYLIVKLQFGEEYRCLLQKNDSTGVYRLTFKGETFTKK